MKRRLLRVGLPVIIGVIVVLWIIARLLGWLSFYKAPSESNMPTIKPGSYFALTNLKQPKRYSFIGYKYFYESANATQIFLHRLIGLPGDTLEIRGGIVFINGRNADSGLILKHTYVVPPDERMAFQDLEPSEIRPGNGDTSIVMLPTNSPLITPKIKRVTLWDASVSHIEMEKVWHTIKWDTYNFGQVVVPRDKVFVLGDNRENAMDSRYIGFIPEKDIVGVKL